MRQLWSIYDVADDLCFHGRTGMQVLLSCSHTFHKQCLRNFELFSQVRCCPICRAHDYQKRAVGDGNVAYRHGCATRIQAHWKGYAARKHFKEWRVQHPPNHPLLRRGWLEDKLQWQAGRLVQEMTRQRDDLSALFAECDQVLEAARPVFDSAAATMASRQVERRSALVVLKPLSIWDEAQVQYAPRGRDNPMTGVRDEHGVCWADVLQSMLRRGQDECPICMGILARQSGQGCSLLSCSHCFHTHCIAAFEGFECAAKHGGDALCPVCRSEYTRRAIDTSHS
jgi:hypothetical protein